MEITREKLRDPEHRARKPGLQTVRGPEGEEQTGKRQWVGK